VKHVLDGTVALVTGASSGIGAATAAALAGWLATATQRECLRVLRARRPPTATSVTGTGSIADQHTDIAGQELPQAERHTALRERSPACRHVASS
jgi:NADP-dependent 3-hydroxy acid dehydrogenase YdfG